MVFGILKTPEVINLRKNNIGKVTEFSRTFYSNLCKSRQFFLDFWQSLTPWIQEVNWTYIRHSEDIQDGFRTIMYVQFRSCVQGVKYAFVDVFMNLGLFSGMSQVFRWREIFNMCLVNQYFSTKVTDEK